MKYEFIKVNRSDHRVVKMCKVLEVNESGYYRWLRRKLSEREKTEANIVAKMKEIHAANYRAYGPSRMQRALAKEKIVCSISTVTRLMRCNGLYTVHRIKKQPCPEEVTERLYSENLVDRQFDVLEPNRCWAGDLTYIRTEQGWAYMAVVLDLFNREVVGYANRSQGEQQIDPSRIGTSSAAAPPPEKHHISQRSRHTIQQPIFSDILGRSANNQQYEQKGDTLRQRLL